MPACLDLRSWLEHLQQQDRLAIMKPGRQLEFEIAGIANRWGRHKGQRLSKAWQPYRYGCLRFVVAARMDGRSAWRDQQSASRSFPSGRGQSADLAGCGQSAVPAGHPWMILI